MSHSEQKLCLLSLLRYELRWVARRSIREMELLIRTDTEQADKVRAVRRGSGAVAVTARLPACVAAALFCPSVLRRLPVWPRPTTTPTPLQRKLPLFALLPLLPLPSLLPPATPLRSYR